jgi:hypothetical protein
LAAAAAPAAATRCAWRLTGVRACCAAPAAAARAVVVVLVVGAQLRSSCAPGDVQLTLLVAARQRTRAALQHARRPLPPGPTTPSLVAALAVAAASKGLAALRMVACR